MKSSPFSVITPLAVFSFDDKSYKNADFKMLLCKK